MDWQCDDVTGIPQSDQCGECNGVLTRLPPFLFLRRQPAEAHPPCWPSAQEAGVFKPALSDPIWKSHF